MTAPVLRIHLLDALATLRGLPAVDASRLGAIGFCFGGQCVLDLARAGADIKVGVSSTAENLALDATKTFGFQPDIYRRSCKAMTDFLAEVLLS
jgi:dienelactone hydrolase